MKNDDLDTVQAPQEPEITPAARIRAAENKKIRDAILQATGMDFDPETLSPHLRHAIANKLNVDLTPFDDDHPENPLDLEDRLHLSDDEKHAQSGGHAIHNEELPFKIREILKAGPRGSVSHAASAAEDRAESHDITPTTAA
jgi:hypothetical protein